jgi:1,2-diacylglycerol 3-beta-galactosyltransferase
MKKLDLIFFDAGGGHRSAATALRLVIQQQQRPWEVRLVNLQEVLDPLDIFRKFTGLRLQDVYNLMLKKGWTLGTPQLVRAMHGLIRLYHPGQVRLLEDFWRQDRPDLVVSLVPNFNRALGEAVCKALPGVPFVTILTDLADYPPHFWMERQPQFFVCGTDRSVEQARAMGHAAERVFRTSGMILHPRFCEPLELDRAAERQRLGLDAERPTGLVLFGGQGSRLMRQIARRLEGASLDLQLIFICGHNEELRRALATRPHRLRWFVEGFTTEVPYYMALSDFFIGKPGPGSISEALAMKLPVIVASNAWTMPQERYNTQWLRENGLGIVVRGFRQIAAAVEQMLHPETFDRLRANAAALTNRAVFEIPDLLARLLSTRS